MKIALYTPFENRWKDSLQKVFLNKGYDAFWVKPDQTVGEIDAVLTMWCDEATVALSHNVSIPIYTYIRAYEIYTDIPNKVNWEKIKGIFFCSEYNGELANMRFPQIKEVPQYIIPNWIDTKEWPLVKNEKSKDIAMVCSINYKKNLPLAFQIMVQLPSNYKLHIIGEVQDISIMLYLESLYRSNGMGQRIFFYNPVEPKYVSAFLEDKGFILSTSVREGNPMNVLEAMAMGVKPVIHNWPGAEQFNKKWIFNWINEVQGILEGDYNPQEYRDFVEKNHSLKNAEKLVEIVTNGN